MTTQMNPLWIEYPDIPWGSIGWRMGGGEDYWDAWRASYLALDASGRERYRRDWPEPASWEGWYEFIVSGRKPPWAMEHSRRLVGPYAAPTPEELRIDDYHRLVWLIRRYMIRLSDNEVLAKFAGRPLGLSVNESLVQFYAEPNGAWWRLSDLLSGGLFLHRLTAAGAPDRLLFQRP